MATIDQSADRATLETQARRRRANGVTDAGLDLKLSIPAAVKAAHPDAIFCWANDTGARIHDLTVLDDWDKVEGIDPRPVGSDEKGHPVSAILLKKPRAFYVEDEARAEARRRDIERGQVSDQLRADDDDTPERFRNPEATKGNRIGGIVNR